MSQVFKIPQRYRILSIHLGKAVRVITVLDLAENADRIFYVSRTFAGSQEISKLPMRG